MATVLKNSAIFRHSFRIQNQMNGSAENLYGRPTQQSRVTLTNINQKFKKQIPITMTTAYDYSSAVHVDTAGIDICLVGDSASMVVHGHDNTLPITLDDIIVHCRAVRRAATHPFIVGDLPFGSYETTPQQAVDSSMRIMKEGGVDAIKLEGASHSRIAAAKEIVGAGIALMGHVGLTPQSISVLGGFKAQGRNTSSAVKVVENAIALQEAGCFAVILECVPAPVAAAATSVLKIPTIGIGAGPFCAGQVLVYHDLLGMLQHPHHAKVTPKFCKQYTQVGAIITNALMEYKEEVIKGSFPGSLYSPYKINESYLDGFFNELKMMGFDKAASAAVEAVQKMENEHQQQLHNLEIGVVASNMNKDFKFLDDNDR